LWLRRTKLGLETTELFYGMAEVNISENLIKCELLCYIQNYYDKSPKDNINAAVSTFYASSEIDAAKVVLADVMPDILDDTELAMLTKRLSGQNKRRSDTEDILLMYDRLDKTVTNMPTFVATKLKRLPSSSPSEVDVCALAANVNELQTQMEVMSEAIKNLVKGQTRRAWLPPWNPHVETKQPQRLP